ncbi:MAG: histidine kinase [Bacteroidota bacterium]
MTSIGRHLLVFISFVFFLSGRVFSQQPAYFVFGEEQFRGVQIYDIIQDKDLSYWFATGEGLYYFDYHTYKKIECGKAKGSSVFNFVINNEGLIYCHNLNNQVFQINNKECSLFYELTSSESSPDISLAIADDGNLIIGAKKILVLDKTGKKIVQRATDTHYLGQAFITPQNSIQFHLNGVDSVLSYEKGALTKKKLKFISGKLENESVLKFFKIEAFSYALDLKTKEQYSYNPTTYELILLPKNTIFERSEAVRLYETQYGLWVTGSLPGVALIQHKITGENYPIYYEDYFVSDVYKDNEGNILLSTFDKGILIIPDTKVPDVIHPFRDDPATALYSDSTLGLVIGTSKGNLMNYINNKLTIINDKGKRPVEAIYGHPTSDLLIFDNGHIRVYNKQNHVVSNIMEASLKDAVIISKNKFYLGTNRGIIEVIRNGDHAFSIKRIKGMDSRIYFMEFNSEDSSLYASTANGLFAISPSGSAKQIMQDGKPIFPNGLTYADGKIYAGTKKHGVLVIQKNIVMRVIRPAVNDKEEILKKIIIYNSSIIAESSNGLFQFDMNGKLLKTIHSVFGFSSKRIIDFNFHQGKLWVSHSGGVQPIDLNYGNKNQQKPVIRLDEILVNDEVIDPLKIYSLKSDQRKIQFIFSSPTLKNRETVRYHYKLSGADSKWNVSGQEINQITYPALASGDYTFYVKTENEGVFSEPVTYSFVIVSPFYTRWWFIATLIFLFLIIVFMVYRWQLNIQRKKSQQINELNASKLTAIQSQMNPHFIFNSLNSIQDLILKGDVEHSYSYITTFSNLVRRTLSYSEKDFIDFDQEIKLLELYLSLEKLRFKKELNYTIDIKNAEDIMLPPLLIQPFIENSLIHGLLHKEGQKNLKITFELKDTLICTVEDNGIGREKSKAIKLRQRSEHESFSGKAIHKRFEILSNVFGRDFGYTYEDLCDDNKEAIGTKVTLSIPVKHKF